MAKVRTRKETGTLFIDFRHMNIRFREQTALPNTPPNRRKVEKLVDMMEAKMLLNQFDYAEFFPNSPNLAKINVRNEARAIASFEDATCSDYVFAIFVTVTMYCIEQQSSNRRHDCLSILK